MFTRQIKIVCLAAVCIFVFAPGCYQRTIAPEMTFNQSEVDLLKKEMEKFEWE